MTASTEQELAGRTVLVTGGASGIGGALARRIARQGAHAVIADRDREAGRRVAEEVGGAFVEVDLEQTEQALATLRAAVQRLDGLVHAAGVGDRDAFPDVAAADWDRVHTINLRAPFLLTQGLVDRFGEGGGSIVNVASVAGSRVAGVSGRISHPYSAAKAGLIMLTRTLAVELAPRAIRVNCVSPGFVATPLTAGMGSADEVVPRVTPLGRWGEPHEQAEAIAYLLSDRASFTTGAELIVDGGVSLRADGGVELPTPVSA